MMNRNSTSSPTSFALATLRQRWGLSGFSSGFLNGWSKLSRTHGSWSGWMVALRLHRFWNFSKQPKWTMSSRWAVKQRVAPPLREAHEKGAPKVPPERSDGTCLRGMPVWGPELEPKAPDRYQSRSGSPERARAEG